MAEPIDPGADVGHIHLRVADLDRSVRFYRDALGFEVQQAGRSAAFLSAGGYHHHVALNTWQSLGGSPPSPGSTGLFHVAFRYPGRAALAKAVKRVLEHGVVLTGASDHGVSEAVYFRDPDDNGVELYYDRPKDEWPRPPEGSGVAMYSEPLDVEALLAEAD